MIKSIKQDTTGKLYLPMTHSHSDNYEKRYYDKEHANNIMC